MSTPHLISSRPALDACYRCGALIASAISEGLRIRVDLMAANATTELQALIEKRESYAFSDGVLLRRDVERINGTSSAPVLLAHQCVKPDDRCPF